MWIRYVKNALQTVNQTMRYYGMPWPYIHFSVISCECAQWNQDLRVTIKLLESQTSIIPEKQRNIEFPLWLRSQDFLSRRLTNLAKWTEKKLEEISIPWHHWSWIRTNAYFSLSPQSQWYLLFTPEVLFANNVPSSNRSLGSASWSFVRHCRSFRHRGRQRC
jgi:hypothetical protein